MIRVNSFRSRLPVMLLLPWIIFQTGCLRHQKQEEYLSRADFATMKKVDIHCHINTKRPDFMEQAVKDNFHILTINTDAFDSVPIEKQQEIALFQMQAFPGRIHYLTTFSMDGWDEPGWQKKTIAYLSDSFKKGAIGVKVWKNIGMVEKDKDGNFIMIDNPKFDPVIDYIIKQEKPICGHLGEPKDCWLPVDEMEVNDDKKYYKEYPQYHMYLHPEYPSYEDQINARDHMLKKHPDLKFIGAHLGSLEWSVDELAKHFEEFPNMQVDMAGRFGHLEVQSRKDRDKVRNFFIKYQDRILYGTDMGDYEGWGRGPVDIKTATHDEWMKNWIYLTTDDTLSSWKVGGEFRGLKLPKQVVEKIYHENAEKLFPGI